MDIHERIKRLTEIGESYVQQVAKTANESMGVARYAYFETIKIMLGMSFAALPLLATVFGLKGQRLQAASKNMFLLTAVLFVLSIVLGIIALLITASTFRSNAYEHQNELQRFLGKCEASNYNPDVIEGYFKEGRKKTIQEGIFGTLQLTWFIGQLLTFLIGLGVFLAVIYNTV